MKKRFLALALGTLAFGVTLGGVKMGLGHQDAMMVKAATETSTTFDATSDKSDGKTISKDGVTISTTVGTLNEGVYKFYKNSVVTFSSTDMEITSIEFECTGGGTSKYGPGCFEGDSGYSYNQKKGTWKGTSKNVSFTASTNQVRATKITVTLASSSQPDPEPASPVATVTVKAKEGSTFYAGTSVSTSDFVFTGFDADGKETTLAGDITIENPLLVEGKNTIKFIYQSGETSVNFECEVNAIKTTLYTKTINVKDITVGKRILIAGQDGAAVLGAETVINKKKVRALVTGKPNNGTLLPTEGFVPLVVLPAKNGSFALYDETAKGVLCATSSSDNIMGTETNFASIDANSFATIAAGEKDGDFVIKFSGNFTKNILSCNTANPRFSCYSSTQSPTSIFVSNEEPVSFNADAWADSFIANVSSKCDATGATAAWTADWNKAKEVFEGFGIPDKMAVLYGTGSEKVNQAIATYKFIVGKYNTVVDDYLGLRTGNTTKANALMLPGATDSTTWTLVGIGAVTIAASASLLFFRRKKSN